MSRKTTAIFAVTASGWLAAWGVAPAFAASSSSASVAPAAVFSVYAGYADCPHAPTACDANKVTNPAYPNPWFGAKGVRFVADPTVVNPARDEDPDTSALRVDNAGSASLTINDVSVSGCGQAPLDLWGTSPDAYPYAVPAGGVIVFSSSSGDNFDGSEICSSAPKVTIEINGVKHTFSDNIANGKRGALHGSPTFDETTPWTKIAGTAGTIEISPTVLSPGTVGSAYAKKLWAQDSNGAPTFKAASALPPGLALSTSGRLTGTPTKAGRFTIKVSVTDTATPPDAGSGTYTLTINGA